MSKHSVRAGNVAALLARVSELKRKASERTGKYLPIVVTQEAGLDGFWLHRVLQDEGIESHVVNHDLFDCDVAQTAARQDRQDRRRGAASRAIGVQARRTSGVRDSRAPTRGKKPPPSVAAKVLIAERVRHVNGVKGLLFSRALREQPLRRDRRQRLDELTTGDGRPLPVHLKIR